MFIKDFHSKVSLDEDIVENENNLEVFELMKKRLSIIGYDVILLTSIERESSHFVVSCGAKDKFAWYSKGQKEHYKDIPILSIYIRTIDNYKEHRKKREGSS